jgi:hypothetical protein
MDEAEIRAEIERRRKRAIDLKVGLGLAAATPLALCGSPKDRSVRPENVSFIGECGAVAGLTLIQGRTLGRELLGKFTGRANHRRPMPLRSPLPTGVLHANHAATSFAAVTRPLRMPSTVAEKGERLWTEPAGAGLGGCGHTSAKEAVAI